MSVLSLDASSFSHKSTADRVVGFHWRQLDFHARTANFRFHPHAEEPISRRERKVTKGVSIPSMEFWARRRPRWERNFSRLSRTPSLHTLSHPSPRTLRFPLLFFFSPLFLSFLLFRIRARRVVCTEAKLSVISDGMARLTPARFYAPSWITCARTSIVCTRAWRWKLEKKPELRAEVLRCEHNETRRSGWRDAHRFVQQNS